MPVAWSTWAPIRWQRSTRPTLCLHTLPRCAHHWIAGVQLRTADRAWLQVQPVCCCCAHPSAAGWAPHTPHRVMRVHKHLCLSSSSARAPAHVAFAAARVLRAGRPHSQGRAQMIDTHRARVEGASREERIGCDAVLALRLGLNQRLDQAHVLQGNCHRHSHHRRPASDSHSLRRFFSREQSLGMERREQTRASLTESTFLSVNLCSRLKTLLYFLGHSTTKFAVFLAAALTTRGRDTAFPQ